MTPASQFLELDVAAATSQWGVILDRSMPETGSRQVNYLPVEVVTCLALLPVVDPRRQGWGSYHPLLEQIARLVKRSPGSLAEKERNLTGTRPNAAAGERALFRAVIETPELVFMLWAVAVAGAREAGIGPSVLPDVLDAETTDGRLLGQDELDEDLRDLVAEERGSYEAKGFDPETSERAAVTMARLGQHRFSVTVRDNYNRKCGFCGLDTASLPKSRLLVASHVKPWRDGTTEERLDPRNGIAACPTHDAAFDTGLLTITNDGRIHTAQLLREATERDRAAHAMFTRTVSDRLIVEAGVRPKSGYLTWHQERIWRNGVGAL